MTIKIINQITETIKVRCVPIRSYCAKSPIVRGVKYILTGVYHYGGSNMLRFIIESTISLMLSVTSADLLYLYYIGTWYDPVILIEISEVVLLYILAIMGLVYFIWRVKHQIRLV